MLSKKQSFKVLFFILEWSEGIKNKFAYFFFRTSDKKRTAYPLGQNKRKSFRRGSIAVISSIIFFILILLIIWFTLAIFLPKDSNNQENVVFIIEQGMGSEEISKALKEQGLIKSKIAFDIWVFVSGKDDSLMAGGYDLSSAMSANQIISKLISGEVALEDLIIKPGMDLRDIGWWFENQGMFQAEEMFELVGFPAVRHFSTSSPEGPGLPYDFSDEFSFLQDKPGNVSLEGYLYPDTYQIEKGETVKMVARKILSNFDQKVTGELRNEIKAQGRTIFEVINLASLLEKEVKTREDKEIVAGIILKRIRNGWLIQIDATLTYLTGKSSGGLTNNDKKIESPYNTYKYFDLPLGPIANPGIDSIEAAVYYKNSPYWYYLTTPEGETKFGQTLEDHNYYKAIYLR